jgi:3-isopropylmalate/(R)-2-methylmalate dehydratase small subunit
MKTIQGKAWKFGDGIDTDIIIPARYLVLPLEEMKGKAMEPLWPTFSSDFEKGGVIVAGKNFGCGSSREQAPAVLEALGVSAIIAESFARIFYRNAINLGMPVVECEGISQRVEQGDAVEIDLSTGRIRLTEQGKEFSGSKLPDFLLDIIRDGGLVRMLTKDRRPPDGADVIPDTPSERSPGFSVVRRASVTPVDFDGLSILDYTAGGANSSSVAQITVPAGGKHRRAWSKRSDKYYAVTSGEVRFEVDDGSFILASGDLCIIRKGSRFSYCNTGDRPATMLLVHTPYFNLEFEVFEE